MITLTDGTKVLHGKYITVSGIALDETSDGLPMLTGSGVTISGTTGRIAKFTNTATIGDSILTELSGKIGLGTTSPQYELEVVGGIGATGSASSKLTLATTGITSKARLGADGNGFFLQENAYWDGVAWQRDDTSKPSFALAEHISSGRYEFRIAGAATGPITWVTPLTVNTTGLTVTGTLSASGKITASGSLLLPSNGEIQSAYNNNGAILKDHNNGNVSLNAAGGYVFLGYQNSGGIDFLNGKAFMDSTGAMSFYNMLTLSNEVVGPHVVGYGAATNVPKWVQVSRRMQGPNYLGGSKRMVVTVYGDVYEKFPVVRYYISGRGGLKVTREILNGTTADLTLHTLKIYVDTSKADNDPDYYVVGLVLGSGTAYWSISVKAELYHIGSGAGVSLTVTEAPEPSTGYTLATPPITDTTLSIGALYTSGSVRFTSTDILANGQQVAKVMWGTTAPSGAPAGGVGTIFIQY